MRPQPRSAIPVTKARLHKNVVVRLRSISARHSANVSCATGRSTSGLALLANPALLTRTSTSPNCSITASASAPTSASSVRSATKPVTPSSVARSWMRRVVDTIATVAPTSRSRRAVAYPMPSSLPAPVTSATRPSRLSPVGVVWLLARPAVVALSPVGTERSVRRAAGLVTSRRPAFAGFMPRSCPFALARATTNAPHHYWSTAGTLTWLGHPCPAMPGQTPRQTERLMSYPQQPGGWSDPSWPSQQPQQTYNPYDPAAGQPVSGQPVSGQPMSPQAAPYGGYGYPAYAPVAPSRSTNGMAIASLVCSVVGIATCGVTAVVGAILGHVARRQIRTSGEDGDGMALAGIIIGWILTGIFLVILTFYVVAIVIAFGSASTSSDFDTTDFSDLMSVLSALR